MEGDPTDKGRPSNCRQAVPRTPCRRNPSSEAKVGQHRCLCRTVNANTPSQHPPLRVLKTLPRGKHLVAATGTPPPKSCHGSDCQSQVPLTPESNADSIQAGLNGSIEALSNESKVVSAGRTQMVDLVKQYRSMTILAAVFKTSISGAVVAWVIRSLELAATVSWSNCALFRGLGP